MFVFRSTKGIKLTQARNQERKTVGRGKTELQDRICPINRARQLISRGA